MSLPADERQAYRAQRETMAQQRIREQQERIAKQNVHMRKVQRQAMGIKETMPELWKELQERTDLRITHFKAPMVEPAITPPTGSDRLWYAQGQRSVVTWLEELAEFYEKEQDDAEDVSQV